MADWSSKVYISKNKKDVVTAKDNMGTSKFTCDGLGILAILAQKFPGLERPGYREDGYVIIGGYPFTGYQSVLKTDWGIYYLAKNNGRRLPIYINDVESLTGYEVTGPDLLNIHSDLYEYLQPILNPTTPPTKLVNSIYEDDNNRFVYGFALGTGKLIQSNCANSYSLMGINYIGENDAGYNKAIFYGYTSGDKTRMQLILATKQTLPSIHDEKHLITTINGINIYKSSDDSKIGAEVYINISEDANKEAIYETTWVGSDKVTEYSDYTTYSEFMKIIEKALDGYFKADYMDLNIPGNSEQANARYQFINPVAGLAYTTAQKIIFDWDIVGASKNPYVKKHVEFNIPANSHCFVLFTGKYVGVYCTAPTNFVMDVYNGNTAIGQVTKQSAGGVLEIQDLFGMYEGYEPVGGVYNVKIQTPFVFIRQIYKCASRDQLPKKGEPTYEIFQPGTSSAYVNPNDTGELASVHFLKAESLAALKAAADAEYKGGGN